MGRSREVDELVAHELGGTPAAWAEVRARDDNTVYRVVRPGGGAAYVKVGADLAGERDRLAWLAGRLPVPEVLGWGTPGSADCLITAAVPGDDLTAFLPRPDALVRLLAGALRMFHTLDPDGCPFGEPAPGAVVTHGDACLPNVLADGTGVTGFIDVGDAGLASPEADLAAALWSLHYNLGDGRYGREFAEAYGLPGISDAELRALRESY
ncbi:phosphotransferase [Sinosporangium siamense]|uniref:Phosphotransferase n=1 Tax=Sinosporangium siamense TaxID=1367973 RepID=A0A919RHA7_9ACTN|nr:phosphotransferase [Sinosporangium siamense]GII91839.1 putative phosphotransferase [Sinosporangium siamense]